MEIRKAETSDVEVIVKLISNCVIETHSELYPDEDLQETLNNYTLEKVINHINVNNYFIALIDLEIVGCVLTVDNMMKSLYVSPAHMKKGIGRRLVKWAEDSIKDNGYKEVSLWSSLIAHEFYQKMGYEDIRDVPNRDGLVLHYDMKKSLTS